MERWAVVVAGFALLRAVGGLVRRPGRRRIAVVGGLASSTAPGWLVRERGRLVLVVRTARWSFPLDPPSAAQARREVRRLVLQPYDEAQTRRTPGLVLRDARSRVVVVAPLEVDGSLDDLRTAAAGRPVRWSSLSPSWLRIGTVALSVAWLVVAVTLGGVAAAALAAAAAALVVADLTVSAVWRLRPPTPVTPVLLHDPALLGPWTRARLDPLDVVALLRLSARTEGRSSMEHEGLRVGLRDAMTRTGQGAPAGPVTAFLALATLAVLVQPLVPRTVCAVLASLAGVWVVLDLRARDHRSAARRRTAPSTWVTLSEPGNGRLEPAHLWLLDGDRTPWVVAVEQPLPPDAVVDLDGALEDGAPVDMRWEGEWQVTTEPLKRTTLGDVNRARAGAVRALRLCWPESGR